MEARLLRAAAAASALLFLGASYRTPNFVVTAPTAEFAKQVGDEAERFRRELAVLWLGKPLPKWAQPCPITLQVGPQLGAGGATSFVFDRGEVFNWQMSIQGSEERILDSVLPHEVTHTIFASHFRQPLPRWADEGACTTVEHESERAKQRQMLINFLKEDRGIAFSRMFAMKDYPPDVLPLYAQGYSLCRFLIEQRDRRTFVRFVGDGLETNAWTGALDRHYGFKSLAQLQETWLEWVRAGSPLQRRSPEQGNPAAILAANPAPATTSNTPAPAPQHALASAPAAAKLGELVPIQRPSRSASRDGEQLAAVMPPVGSSPAADSGAVASGGPSAYSAQPVQLTRPQPTQRPQQRVLEWAQPSPQALAAAEPSASTTAPRSSAPGVHAGNQSAAAAPPIKLSPSAAQRYLPAALARQRAGQPTAANNAPRNQAAHDVAAGG